VTQELCNRLRALERKVKELKGAQGMEVLRSVCICLSEVLESQIKMPLVRVRNLVIIK
jgi:hypothetical protein